MNHEWIYKKQRLNKTWAEACENISRVLSDSDLKAEANVDLARKILLSLGFKNES